MVAYELWQVSSAVNLAVESVVATELANADDMARFYEHLRQVLFAIKFLDPRHSKKLMYRLQRLFNRARVEQTELNILRGILSAVQNISEQK